MQASSKARHSSRVGASESGALFVKGKVLPKAKNHCYQHEDVEDLMAGTKVVIPSCCAPSFWDALDVNNASDRVCGNGPPICSEPIVKAVSGIVPEVKQNNWNETTGREK